MNIAGRWSTLSQVAEFSMCILNNNWLIHQWYTNPRYPGLYGCSLHWGVCTWSVCYMIVHQEYLTYMTKLIFIVYESWQVKWSTYLHFCSPLLVMRTFRFMTFIEITFLFLPFWHFQIQMSIISITEPILNSIHTVHQYNDAESSNYMNIHHAA